jgi:hypothetical protein
MGAAQLTHAKSQKALDGSRQFFGRARWLSGPLPSGVAVTVTTNGEEKSKIFLICI